MTAAPLESHRAAYGVLALFFAGPRPFGDDERAALRTLAIHAAIALDNRRLMRDKEHMAVRDGLTDVFNRGYLELAMERTVKDVRRNGGDVSILFVDVDGMKHVNDTHGHHAGDVLLVELAQLLRDSCRDGRRRALRRRRVRGPHAEHRCRRRRRGGAQGGGRDRGAQRGRHAPPRLSASTGTHTATADGVDTLLQEADRQMYAAKRTRAPPGGLAAGAPLRLSA